MTKERKLAVQSILKKFSGAFQEAGIELISKNFIVNNVAGIAAGLYKAESTQLKAKIVIYSMMRRIMGIDIKISHDIQANIKETVAFEDLWNMANTWRDFGCPEIV